MPASPLNKAVAAKIEEWFALAEELPTKIAREKQLRQELFNHLFPAPLLGTNRLDIGHGKDLKAVHGMSYSVDRTLLKEHGEKVPSELLHRVIKFKPEVAVGEWNKSTPEDKNKLSLFVTEKVALPSMEITNKSQRSR